MTPAQFVAEVIEPGAAWVESVCGVTSSPDAKRFLLAVAIQESDLQHRYQVLAGGAPGPARSWWQGEQTGGMIRVLTSSSVASGIRAKAAALCAAAQVRPEPAAVWRAIEGHDRLAYGLARLLLFSDPYQVPAAQESAWACYAHRLWRPGKPNLGRWLDAWAQTNLTHFQVIS